MTTISYVYQTPQNLSADTNISYNLDFARQPDGTSSNSYHITINLIDDNGNTIDSTRVFYVIEDSILISASIEGTLSTVISGITGSGDQVTTTTDSIPFGTLSDGSAKTAKLHLKTQTNAANGYQVKIKGNASLSSANDQDTINAVAASNASPAAWPSVNSSNTSAFGYHSSDENLNSGTSARFSSADTFAALSGTPSVVFDGSGPTAGINAPTENDASGGHLMEFKIEIDSLHPAGIYSGMTNFVTIPRY